MKRTDLPQLPSCPGVYFYYGPDKEILYIGRATNLKRRVSQYFRRDLEPRIAEMVALATDLKFETTETLLEAIILEANLIKKYWPKYNVKDRDDRSFIYIVIPKKPFPAPILVRGRELKRFPDKDNQVFGPYQSYYLLQTALRLLRKIFPYGTCKPHSGRPCFDYQIGLCPGACVDAISEKAYAVNIKALIDLLSGKRRQLLKRLSKAYPEKARALKQLQEVALLEREDNLSTLRPDRLEGYDISHLAGGEPYGSMVVFENNAPAKDQYRLFKIKTAIGGDDERSLAEVLERRFNHEEWPRPDLIMIDGGRPQIDFLTKFLEKKNIAVSLVGISKYGGDRLVYQPGASRAFKALAENLKPILLRLRDEAHRFVIAAGRKRRRRDILK
jgi:excinuclease ABC subunit C